MRTIALVFSVRFSLFVCVCFCWWLLPNCVCVWLCQCSFSLLSLFCFLFLALPLSGSEPYSTMCSVLCFLRADKCIFVFGLVLFLLPSSSVTHWFWCLFRRGFKTAAAPTLFSQTAVDLSPTSWQANRRKPYKVGVFFWLQYFQLLLQFF